MANDTVSRKQQSSSNVITLLGNYLPRQCGIATFTTDLLGSLAAQSPGTEYWAIAMNDTLEGYDYPARVRFEVSQNKLQEYQLSADFLNINRVETVCLQHEFGIFGGNDGSHILALLKKLRMPVVTTLHTVLQDPDDGKKAVMRELLRVSDRLVVMSRLAVDMIKSLYSVDADRIVFIPHGIPDTPFIDPNYYKDQFGVEGKRVILTFGLLHPGKGVEHVIDALPAVVDRFPDTVYLVLGATHPHVKRESGEAYRISLQQRARRLGVDKHIIFHNRFVSLEKLCEFLICADIYVTPYLHKEQITSGTLAYAMGAGKAIISTPYWYAEEMLADGRGRLVPFADAEAMAEQILDLFDNPVELNAMRKRAYQFSRDMIWPKVARAYLDIFSELKQEPSKKSFALYPTRTIAETWIDLPEIKFDHLNLLTDDTGVLQHARFMIPSRIHGYTVDDNARALVAVMSARNASAEPTLLEALSYRYLGFLEYAFDDKSGRFRNFLSYSRRWNRSTDYEESHGRALWGLGVTISESQKDSQIGMAMDLFERALKASENFDSPRAVAYALLGIVCYGERFRGDRSTRRYEARLSDRLFDIYRTNREDDWPWIEETVTYDNGRIPQALIASGRERGQQSIVDAGIECLDWLLRIQTDDSGHLVPIGNRGWYRRNGKRTRFDQQPVDAGSMVEACAEAFFATGEERWAKEAVRCFDWFLGRNDIQAPVYDYTTGGCRDGLGADGVNQNQGAESTLAWLVALITMYHCRTLLAASPQ
ncbi:MAG: glycosyltransferase family 4 protein [Spirochaetes bacterium]|nr:glycosyltransferase family 4 protein [Spirochaetota bacterium]